MWGCIAYLSSVNLTTSLNEREMGKASKGRLEQVMKLANYQT